MNNENNINNNSNLENTQIIDIPNNVDVQINKNVPVMEIEKKGILDENNKTVSKGFENVNNTFYEKERKVWPIVLILIFILIIGAGCYYYFVLTKPISIIKRTLNTAYSKVEKISKLENSSSTKINTVSGKLNVIFTSNNEEMNELNGLTANLDFGYDLKDENKNYIDVNANLKNQKLFDAKMSLIQNKIYMDLKEAFSKVIYIENDDEEMSFDILGDINESDIYSLVEDELYLVNLIKNSLIKNISEEKLSKKMLLKDINGKKVPAVEVTYIIDYPEYKKLYKGIIDDILSDNKAVNILSKISDESESEVRDDLSDSKEDLSELDLEGTININLTVDAITNKLIELDIKADKNTLTFTDISNEAKLELNAEDGLNISMTIDEKENKLFMDAKMMNTIRFSITSKYENVSDNEGKINLTFVMYDLEDIDKEMFNIASNIDVRLNEAIKPLDITNAVNADDLSEEDQQKVLNALMPIMGMLSNAEEGM